MITRTKTKEEQLEIAFVYHMEQVRKWARDYVTNSNAAMMPPKPACGVRCHDADACAGDQLPCPTRQACGIL